MIREVILNSFASMLSKKDRDGPNSAVRSIVANPKTFLDNKAFNDYQDWLYYNGGSDRALSPVTLRVFSIVADKLGINAVHVYELWENDQLIFYPDVPGRLTPTMYDSLINWSIDFNKTVKRHFRMFKEGLRKVSKVKFANPELIFLMIQATDKYPFNIFIDDDLGKRYLEKVMSIVSLHYEDWEV